VLFSSKNIETKSFRCGLSLVSIVSLSFLAFLSSVQFAAAASNTTASATADASARVVRPIAISTINDLLRFGTFVPTDEDGTVELDPDGSIRTLDKVDPLPSVPNAFGAAVFDVTGEGGESFFVSFPPSVSLSSGGDTMTLDTFGAYSTPSGTTGIVGDAIPITTSVDPVIIRIGGTLHVGANQAAGNYESSAFNVTVTYQ